MPVIIAGTLMFHIEPHAQMSKNNSTSFLLNIVWLSWCITCKKVKKSSSLNLAKAEQKNLANKKTFFCTPSLYQNCQDPDYNIHMIYNRCHANWLEKHDPWETINGFITNLLLPHLMLQYLFSCPQQLNRTPLVPCSVWPN